MFDTMSFWFSFQYIFNIIIYMYMKSAEITLGLSQESTTTGDCEWGSGDRSREDLGSQSKDPLNEIIFRTGDSKVGVRCTSPSYTCRYQVLQILCMGQSIIYHCLSLYDQTKTNLIISWCHGPCIQLVAFLMVNKPR